ncbi:MAG: 16S rRNA (uracil(1498)-N(3))-methyltransferase [Alphaproteobacteria bacterium]|nr:16S rRNA (uracil(1498)-N(3))-methyltransferase [Alphaproteobacteria bacterium]
MKTVPSNTIINKDDILQLSPQQMHHAINVLRLKIGDSVKVFNENICEWKCVIYDVKKCLVQAVSKIPTFEENIQLIVCFSLIHPNRMSFLLEKVTELGATCIIPIISQYTQQKTINIERAKQILVSASEQCNRITIPKIYEPQKLIEFLNNYSYECNLLVADETLNNTSIEQSIISDRKQYAFLIGPEGGFSDEERIIFRKYPFIKKISLGKNILRSETAALALASVITVSLK